MSMNLIVVFGDEMRGQAMSCAGDPNVRTPNMDRMAAEGRMFSHAFSNSPVCTPARGMMLTGLFPNTHGAIVNDLPVHTDVPSIAWTLQNCGYRCGYVGKWHLGGIPRSRRIPPGPDRLGFDAFWASWNCHHDYFEPKYFVNDDTEPTVADGYEPTVQTDLALVFMRDHFAEHEGNPFCLFLSWGPPHSPYTPWPPASNEMYNPDELILRPNCPDTPDHRRDLAGYYAHITALDAELGRILDFVDESGHTEDTLIVFTSDHGSMLGSQGHYHKQQPWGESLSVPLIMRGPKRLRGAESDLLFSLLDFAPTILGLLGAPVPVRMQGRDLSPQIAHGAPYPRRVIYLAEFFCVDQAGGQGIKPWRGVKTNRCTYARTAEGPWVLYDDVADPFQLENLVDDPSVRDVRNRLDEELDMQMARFNDRIMTPDEALNHFGIRSAFNVRSEFLYHARNMGGVLDSVWPPSWSRDRIHAVEEQGYSDV